MGKVDATAERKAGVLWVNAGHLDVPFTKTMTVAVRREIKEPGSLARLGHRAARLASHL